MKPSELCLNAFDERVQGRMDEPYAGPYMLEHESLAQLEGNYSIIGMLLKIVDELEERISKLEKNTLKFED